MVACDSSIVPQFFSYSMHLKPDPGVFTKLLLGGRCGYVLSEAALSKSAHAAQEKE